jgi:hypothetical protein
MRGFFFKGMIIFWMAQVSETLSTGAVFCPSSLWRLRQALSTTINPQMHDDIRAQIEVRMRCHYVAMSQLDGGHRSLLKQCPSQTHFPPLEDIYEYERLPLLQKTGNLFHPFFQIRSIFFNRLDVQVKSFVHRSEQLFLVAQRSLHSVLGV